MSITKRLSRSPNFSIFCLTALASTTGPILFLILVLIVEAAQPGNNPIENTISTLVWGRLGWLQTIAFIVFGLLIATFGLRLYTSSPKLTTKAGRVCLLLIGLGFILLGIFPAVPPDIPKTPGSSIHTWISEVMSLLFLVALLLITVSLSRGSRQKGLFVYTLATTLLAFFLAIVNALLPRSSPHMGLAERILLLNGMVWIEVMSLRLLRDCRCERSESAASTTSASRPT